MLGFGPLSSTPISSAPLVVTPVTPAPPAYFPHNYFPAAYFTPFYFPPLAAVPVPPEVPIVIVPVAPGLHESDGAAGGYLVPQEFIPTSPAQRRIDGFFGHPRHSRLFGHPKPGQAYPPEFKSITLDAGRQHDDDEELLLIAFLC